MHESTENGGVEVKAQDHAPTSKHHFHYRTLQYGGGYGSDRQRCITVPSRNYASSGYDTRFRINIFTWESRIDTKTDHMADGYESAVEVLYLAYRC